MAQNVPLGSFGGKCLRPFLGPRSSSSERLKQFRMLKDRRYPESSRELHGELESGQHDLLALLEGWQAALQPRAVVATASRQPPRCWPRLPS
eukprot:6894082-Alexandrium_andersonii.AAC.1